MTLYAYRAECGADEQRFINELLDRKIRFRFNMEYMCNGTVMDIDCDDIVKLWKIIKPLPDCHVMAETFEHLGNFSGVRRGWTKAPDQHASEIRFIDRGAWKECLQKEEKRDRIKKIFG